MTDATQGILSLAGLAIFAVGILVGRFLHRDRRITHEAPRTIQPSLLKQWRSDRLVREVGNRRRT